MPTVWPAHVFFSEIRQTWRENLETFNQFLSTQAPQPGMTPWYRVKRQFCLYCLTPTNSDGGSRLFARCCECGRLAAIDLSATFDLDERKLVDEDGNDFVPHVALDALYDFEENYLAWWLPRFKYLMDLTRVIHNTDTIVQFHSQPMSYGIVAPLKLFNSERTHYIRGRSNRAWWDRRFPRWGDGVSQRIAGAAVETECVWMRITSVMNGEEEMRRNFLAILPTLTDENVFLDPAGADALREDLRESEWNTGGRGRWIRALGAPDLGENIEVFDALWDLATQRIGSRGTITTTGGVTLPITEALNAITAADLRAIAEQFEITVPPLTVELRER